MKTFLLAAAVAALAGCGAGELQIPEKVSVPVAVACLSDEETAKLAAACPELRADAEILALDDYKVIQALRSDRVKAGTCLAALKPAIAICAKIPAAASPPLDGRRERGGAGGDPAGADPH